MRSSATHSPNLWINGYRVLVVWTDWSLPWFECPRCGRRVKMAGGVVEAEAYSAGKLVEKNVPADARCSPRHTVANVSPLGLACAGGRDAGTPRSLLIAACRTRDGVKIRCSRRTP